MSEGLIQRRTSLLATREKGAQDEPPVIKDAFICCPAAAPRVPFAWDFSGGVESAQPHMGKK